MNLWMLGMITREQDKSFSLVQDEHGREETEFAYECIVKPEASVLDEGAENLFALA